MGIDQHMTRHRLLTAIVVSLALLAASCGDDSDESSESSTTSTTTSTPATTTSTTTDAPTSSTTSTTTSTTSSSTTTTTTTTVVDEPACPGSGGLPPQAANNTLAAADVDGDGQPDTLHSYTIGDVGQPGAWWLQVSFAGGGGTALQIVDPGANLSGVQVFDGYDIDGSGTDEFFARVGAGASATILGLFEVVECAIERVTVDGAPTEFPVGASLNFVSGLSCYDADVNGFNDFLVLYSGQRLGQTPEFEVTGTQYALQNGALTFILADGIGGNENDADFSDLSSAGCPGLESL